MRFYIYIIYVLFVDLIFLIGIFLIIIDEFLGMRVLLLVYFVNKKKKS